MTKTKIISLSIITIIVATITILFAAVFRLRKLNVVIVGETPITVSREEIISAAGFKKNEAILMLNKEKAITNIEQKYANIKVIQIETTSVNSINIKVRARHEIYYTKLAENFYIMDEELKVLRIVERESEPIDLIYIKENTLKLDSSTLVCDFVGSKLQEKVYNDLFEAMYTTVTKTENEERLFLTRQEICNMIEMVKMENYDTTNKLIIKTKYGVVLDIEKPNKDLQYKINICFSAVNQYIKEGNNKYTSGTIKLFYGLDNQLQFVYNEE